MEDIESALDLIDAMAGIEPGPALDGLAARRLADLPAEMAARVLSELVGQAGDELHARKVVNACCRALLWGTPALSDERRIAIRAAAHALGLGTVVALFTGASAALSADPDARRIDPELAVLTLGHRKQFARTETDPDRIARFAGDGDASVIRNLLINPRITEALVVRIAARRPASAVVLEEIARSQRWSSRRSVRRALALNPYSPPALVNPLLPQLTSVDLEEVATMLVLHPAVRSAAQAILVARRS